MNLFTKLIFSVLAICTVNHSSSMFLAKLRPFNKCTGSLLVSTKFIRPCVCFSTENNKNRLNDAQVTKLIQGLRHKPLNSSTVQDYDTAAQAIQNKLKSLREEDKKRNIPDHLKNELQKHQETADLISSAVKEFKEKNKGK